jgi:hypothetical protein
VLPTLEGDGDVAQESDVIRELERRVEDDSRARFGKLRSKALLQELRRGGAFEYPKLPADLTIDTSELTPAEAAVLIRERL